MVQICLFPRWHTAKQRIASTGSSRLWRAEGRSVSMRISLETRKDDMDWRRHAVLLIDVQNDSLSNTRDFPSFQDSITRLLAFARAGGIEVIHLRVTFKEGDSAEWVEGTYGAEPAPFARETPEEKVFIKHWIDGFYNTGLEEYLRERRIHHVLCAGLATPICVTITALSARQRGFLTTIIRDCCAAPKRYHDFALELYGGFVNGVINLGEMHEKYTRWEEQIANQV